MNGLQPADIHALLTLFEQSDWRSLHLRVGDTELHLDRDAGAPGLETAGGTAAVAAAPAAAPATTAAPPTPDAAPAPGPEPAAADDATVVHAPNLGTFYRAPKPGAAPYVEVGQRVEADTEVCLIEVMKLFTPVVAGVAGTVQRVLVEDGDMVEHGQALFHIAPGD
ncbi:acetyl-CoA carboxylase biotin carboxyl carrier protein [Algiphilus sp.]|uniref:acetyl-CoA carboxylase biotin carboxyl carrier protein n=1 Tax=Algiphilus sp. TaxID=1872431 RepID=UPI0025C2C6F6|nr:acetyl-CoA carboxylase biotin carboxyl carrier protein [Algiphilus sp.]MCK5771194.1 acetyl-CoA carboxylase biotin carboxyl carrier protein [Algiphilus sp.]